MHSPVLLTSIKTMVGPALEKVRMLRCSVAEPRSLARSFGRKSAISRRTAAIGHLPAVRRAGESVLARVAGKVHGGMGPRRRRHVCLAWVSVRQSKLKYLKHNFVVFNA